ncbi:hypothetical protein ONZ45_g17239 [Pleurotus djamor]|nr:hypothetical protein ONZ45_g17239 [Pleurotus djamor]
MQFQTLFACVVACFAMVATAAPVIPPLDVEARAPPNPARREPIAVEAVAREAAPEAEPAPEPFCRYGCI